MCVKQVEEPQIPRRKVVSNSKLWPEYPATPFATVSQDLLSLFELLAALWCRGTETPTPYIRRASYGEFQLGDRRVGPIFWAFLITGILRAGCTSVDDGRTRVRTTG
jgi:hypothetical protein